MVDNSEATLSFQMLREELQTSREAVLAKIKAEISASYQDIKTDITSTYLSEETKADMQSLRDELTSAQHKRRLVANVNKSDILWVKQWTEF